MSSDPAEDTCQVRRADSLLAETDDPVRQLTGQAGIAGFRWSRQSRWSQSAHPLTAPAASPETIFRLKKMNMISGGMVIKSTSMKSRFHWVRN